MLLQPPDKIQYWIRLAYSSAATATPFVNSIFLQPFGCCKPNTSVSLPEPNCDALHSGSALGTFTSHPVAQISLASYRGKLDNHFPKNSFSILSMMSISNSCFISEWPIPQAASGFTDVSKNGWLCHLCPNNLPPKIFKQYFNSSVQ